MSALSTLPMLKNLQIDLQQEEQVDLLMRKLPDLEFLNSLPVDRDALEDSVQEPPQPRDPLHAV